MKKILFLLLMTTFLIVALEGFAVIAAAVDEDSRTFDVNAVEYEDEDETENIGSGLNADLITEEDARREAEEAKADKPENPENPDTGVVIAVIPAAIALAVLIILWILKKKGGRRK